VGTNDVRRPRNLDFIMGEVHECKNIESKIRLFSDDCTVYRNVLNIEEIKKYGEI
jgi:hypothetical protein